MKNVELTDEEIDQAIRSFTISTQVIAIDEKLEKLLNLPRKKKKKHREEIQRLKRMFKETLKIAKDDNTRT
jgi:ribosomal protein S21